MQIMGSAQGSDEGSVAPRGTHQEESTCHCRSYPSGTHQHKNPSACCEPIGGANHRVLWDSVGHFGGGGHSNDQC